jgi:hypothetical protein
VGPQYGLANNKTIVYIRYGARGSSVGIATGYGLDGPGIESRWVARFFAHVQTGPGAHPASCTMGTGPFPGVKGKGKVRGWGLLQHYSLWLIVLLTPKGVPSFISRDAAHQRRAATTASEGRNYRWNLANNPVIHVSC